MKLAIIGNFGNLNHMASDGQTVKTRIVSSELQDYLGREQILVINTYGGRKNLLKAPFQCLRAMLKARNILIFPAHNGIRVYAPILALLSYIIPNKRLHYAVIGGWLPEFIKKRKIIAWALRQFHGIYVETSTMKNAMEHMSYNNIYVMPNCKQLNILNDEELTTSYHIPYKLCTFSRVMKEKGIGDAVNAIKLVNAKFGNIIYTLDIYGGVDASQKEWFSELQATFPEYISYKGCVDFDKSVETVKNYFALLFPTQFFTEGIPGTIIDAYAAGVPVISARWQSFADIVEDGITGIGYEFNNITSLYNTLYQIAINPEIIINQKSSCLKQAKLYTPSSVIKVILDNLL